MPKSNYIKLSKKNIEILDGNGQFVKLKGVLKNEKVSNWLKITLKSKQEIQVTSDHPFITLQGKTIASDLIIGQCLLTEDEEEIEIINIEKIDQIKDSFDVETESGTFVFSGIESSNCRTANLYDINSQESIKKNIEALIEEKPLYDDVFSGINKDGRGNICPTTIILPTLAMEANGDVERFMEILDKTIDEAKDSLIDRFNYIASQSPKSASFMYGNRSMAGYVPEEGIISALRHGTLAIGQVGMAETLELLVGCNQTKSIGMELAKRIEQLYKDKCVKFKEEYKLNFGVYYTPAESLVYTAMKKFKEIYGEIKNVSDHEYFTNSIHIPVREDITPFEKIDLEGQLTGYSSAGCITYVEIEGNAEKNIPAMEKLVHYAMDKDIPYFALNIKLDQCMNPECGYKGEIDKTCPKCGGHEIEHLARVTGYLSCTVENMNLGKQAEVHDRVRHIGKIDC